MKPQTIVLTLLRLALGGLFIYAGAAKLLDVSAFAVEIGNYRLLPDIAPLMAATLPGIEIVSGLALVLGTRVWMRAGALVTGALLVAFTVAVTQVVVRGINVQCGCFGGNSGPVTWVTIVRDLALLGMCAGVWVLSTPATEPATP